MNERATDDKWEYRVIGLEPNKSPEVAQKTLDVFGDEGWQLVAVSVNPSLSYSHFAWLKRQVRSW